MTRLSLLLLLPACGGATPSPSAPPAPPPPPYTSSTPLAAPAIFGRGAISTEPPEFGLSLTPDGTTAYFNRASADRSELSILASRFAGGAWQPAEPVPFSTGAHRDVDPFVAADGQRLYFSSNRPAPGRSAGGDWNTWVVERRGGGWSEPALVPGAASGEGEQTFASVTRDGVIYFGGAGDGGGDLYRAKLGAPAGEPLPASINTGGRESNPAISPDGTLLVFAADRPGGLGSADLYATHYRDGAWTEPRALGAGVNTAFADFAPAISPDGRFLFFTSERPGVMPAVAEGRPPGDIYQIELAAALGE